MRAVKIDPVNRSVTEINLKKNPNNTLQELYEIIGCDLVELPMSCLPNAPREVGVGGDRCPL